MMAKPVPKHLRSMWGSAHAFRSDKRKMVRRLRSDVQELRHGCAFLADEGYKDVQEINDRLDRLMNVLSTKNWGR